MRPQDRDFIRRAVVNAQGDDLARARAAWGGLSDSELDKEYGESARTRREIMAEYEAHDRAAREALAALDCDKGRD